jgi:hypothetical protein
MTIERGDAATPLRFIERLPLWRNRPVEAYGATLVLIVLGFLARVMVEPVLQPGLPFVTFFPVVLISAFLFGTRPAILAAVACGALAWFFSCRRFKASPLRRAGCAEARHHRCGRARRAGRGGAAADRDRPHPPPAA